MVRLRKNRTINTTICSSHKKVKLGVFSGSNYKLEDRIWEHFNWEVEKCVLRSDNNPIKNNI